MRETVSKPRYQAEHRLQEIPGLMMRYDTQGEDTMEVELTEREARLTLRLANNCSHACSRHLGRLLEDDPLTTEMEQAELRVTELNADGIAKAVRAAMED